MLKNQFETIVMVPVKALFYDTYDGRFECGRVVWPDLDAVRDAYLQSLNTNSVDAVEIQKGFAK